MQRKIVAGTAFSWGPLFDFSIKNKLEEYSKEIAKLLSYNQWDGSYRSHLIGRQLCQSSLTRYGWLKEQIGQIQDSLGMGHTDIRLTVEEVSLILPKLKLRVEAIREGTRYYDKDISGLNLDHDDLQELEEEQSSLEGEITSLGLLLGSKSTRKIVVINDREDGLMSSDRTHSVSSESNGNRGNHLSLGHPHSSITLINASEEKRLKIARLFLLHERHPKKAMADIDGTHLYNEDKILLVLSKYTYFLQTDNGLKPFGGLEEVERYLRSNGEENWKSVVKFKIIPDYERKHGLVHVRESVSTYPVTHE